MPCAHKVSDTFTFSGDLICMKCGQVLQANSQLSSEPAYIERSSASNNITNVVYSLSHQERSELALSTLLRKLISSFALKPSYEPETLALMHRHWTNTAAKQKYGMIGNRLLVAVLFLLARRDGLAVNLNLLAASIDSSSQECGAFFEPIIQLEPSLRSLAKVDDFIARSLDLVINQLNLLYGLVMKDINSIIQQTGVIADLLKEAESGSSRSAECTALAATWITLGSVLLLETKIPLESVIQRVTETSALSPKTVKAKYNALIDKLLERAEILLPSTFASKIKLTRPRKIFLLLLNLNEITTGLNSKGNALF